MARILARVLCAAKKDWADLEAAWPEDEYEQLQQQAIQERWASSRLRLPGRVHGASRYWRASRFFFVDSPT